ncbi:SAM-dependent methyltransferase [Streptomyces sp. ACA25]|uniref:SAM-dependent methyltransferase n=1 Tax=Streptomyces sp. ACA25 TaxID=3022596 RepID=UPI0023076D86|nr:SAM-dependent methyltransferase [Streptomyces sp. ACA25]MDB1090110.1 SAM-dependent methyltransferase [Streptomyces sp. ACA25]
MSELGCDPARIDTSKPHPARMYDYYLGGEDNYEVDRAAAEQVMALSPDVVLSARANRDFLQRAVRAVARDGVDQIMDIGTGIPTSPNTHEAAHSVSPGIKVLYIDNDPIVSAYAGAKLINSGNTGFFLGDLREPDAVLAHPELRRLLDLGRPVALLLVAVLHFINDEEDPAGLIAALTGPLPPGSRLVLSHATGDFHPDADTGRGSEIYRKATAHLTMRSREQILPFFSGFDLLDPGLVQASRWQPDGPVPEALNGVAIYGGVGVKR